MPVKLSKKTELVDFIDNVKDAKAHLHSILLWPAAWKKFTAPHSLKWHQSTFSARAKSSIPDQPGVYAFLIEPKFYPALRVAVLMYIGKTDRSLRMRFGEYLKEASDPTGRPAVSFILTAYAGHLTFYCAPVRSPRKPAKVENGLLASFMPPLNKTYPASVRRTVAAFK
jgi:hypothetical protein